MKRFGGCCSFSAIIKTLFTVALIIAPGMLTGCSGGKSDSAPANTNIKAAEITDPQNPLAVLATDDTGNEAIGLLTAKDSNGNVTAVIGITYSNKTSNSGVNIFLGSDGLPAVAYDSAGTKTVFSDYGQNSVNVTVYDSSGNKIAGPTNITINIDDLKPLRDMANAHRTRDKHHSKAKLSDYFTLPNMVKYTALATKALICGGAVAGAVVITPVAAVITCTSFVVSAANIYLQNSDITNFGTATGLVSCASATVSLGAIATGDATILTDIAVVGSNTLSCLNATVTLVQEYTSTSHPVNPSAPPPAPTPTPAPSPTVSCTPPSVYVPATDSCWWPPAPAPVIPPGTVTTIQGQVKYSSTPVAGVTMGVCASPGSWTGCNAYGSAVTDANGNYTITGLTGLSLLFTDVFVTWTFGLDGALLPGVYSGWASQGWTFFMPTSTFTANVQLNKPSTVVIVGNHLTANIVVTATPPVEAATCTMSFLDSITWATVVSSGVIPVVGGNAVWTLPVPVAGMVIGASYTLLASDCADANGVVVSYLWGPLTY